MTSIPGSNEESRSLARSDRFALATVLPLLALSTLMQVLSQSNSDKSWLMLAARMWLTGKRLYVDVVEVSPPLIIWLYSIPARLAAYESVLSGYQLLGLMGVLSAALCIWVSLGLVRLHPMFAGHRRRQAEFALLLAAIFIFLTAQSDFFDREHILYMLTFPYVLRFAPGLARRKPAPGLRLLVALLAALGFCIKPHSLILFTGVQLLVIARERSLAILVCRENLIVYLGVCLYLACILHFTPEYASIIFPMALETYSSFTRGGGLLLWFPSALLAAALIFADFRLRCRSPYRADILYYIGIACAWLAHALASNGWDYTYHPLMCTLTLLAGLVLYEYQWLRQQDSSARRFLFGIRGCAICLATQGIYMGLVTLASVGANAIEAKCHRSVECLRQDPYIRYVHDHHINSFGTITQDFPKWVQVERFTGARWETRFNHLWMLPKLLQENGAPVPSHAWIMAYMTQALADDLDKSKPQIVFVDVGKQFSIYPNYVDLIGFLSVNPAFREAFSHYRHAETIDECGAPKASLFKNTCKYDIYSRMGQGMK